MFPICYGGNYNHDKKKGEINTCYSSVGVTGRSITNKAFLIVASSANELPGQKPTMKILAE
jgi:hypothetical protein